MNIEDFQIDVNAFGLSWKISKTSLEINNFLKDLLLEINPKTEIPRINAGNRPHISLGDYITALKSENITSEILSQFLSALLSIPTCSENVKVKEFIEFSEFSKQSSKKYKEGYVTIDQPHVSNCCSCFSSPTHPKKWMILTDDFLGYTSDLTSSVIEEVLMIKENFKIFSETDFIDEIKITTSRTSLSFRTGTEKKKQEWLSELSKVIKNSQWNKKNLYDSSFPLRPHNNVSFLVDDHNYFEAVYLALQNARFEVLISDWWMSPEVFLLRPSESHADSQLVVVLKKLAEKGVKISVLLYKTIPIESSLDSVHSKEVLKSQIHENIEVVLRPSHNILNGVFLWDHHMKAICIDQKIAFIGSADLCFSRYDTSDHVLVDNLKPYVFNGIDYHNSRLANFSNVSDWNRDTLDRNTQPRMPWHDVGIKIEGLAARDIAINFMEAWNNAIHQGIEQSNSKNVIYPESEAMNGPNQPSAATKEFEKDPSDLHQTMQNKAKNKTNDFVRIFAKSIYQDKQSNNGEAFCAGPSNQSYDLIKEALSKRGNFHQEYLSDVNQSRILRSSPSLLLQTLLRIKQLNIEELINPEYTCDCELIRSASDWSFGLNQTESSIHKAYITLIENSQHFIYIENQYFMSSTGGNSIHNQIAQALVNRIIEAHNSNSNFFVIIILPLLPNNTGKFYDSNSNTLKLLYHLELQTIIHSDQSIFTQLLNHGIEPHNYIRFFSLRKHGIINSVPVTELVYVHSKIMIVDDDIAIIGSANINDRSMLGNRDSEIALVIRDNNKIVQRMGGKRWVCGKFTADLRKELNQEHLGPNSCDLDDPIASEFLEYWINVAENNTKVYRKIFMCYPDNEVKTYEEMKKRDQYMQSDEGKQQKVIFYEAESGLIRGKIVEFPAFFLFNESLSADFFSVERLVPKITFN